MSNNEKVVLNKEECSFLLQYLKASLDIISEEKALSIFNDDLFELQKLYSFMFKLKKQAEKDDT